MDAKAIGAMVVEQVKAKLTAREALDVLDRFGAELTGHPAAKAKVARARRNLLRVATGRAIRRAIALR